MKKKYYTIFGCVLLASMLTACVEQYDVYDYPHDRLGFAYETDPSGPGHKIPSGVFHLYIWIRRLCPTQSG